MLAIYIDCHTPERMEQEREKIHESLVGSPAYVESEIAVCEENQSVFILVVGNRRPGYDLRIDVDVDKFYPTPINEKPAE